jgi:hypothetical protein
MRSGRSLTMKLSISSDIRDPLVLGMILVSLYDECSEEPEHIHKACSIVDINTSFDLSPQERKCAMAE